MATYASWRTLGRWMIAAALALTAGTTIVPSAAEASSPITLKYCDINMDTNVEKCFRTVPELQAYQAGTNAEIALTVWNWNGFNPTGGFRQYTGTHFCGDFSGVVASDANLSDSFYSNVHTIMNNTIGSFRTEFPCGVAFWDYNNYGGARLPADPSAYLGGECANLATCTPEGNWNNRAGALLVVTGETAMTGSSGDLTLISMPRR